MAEAKIIEISVSYQKQIVQKKKNPWIRIAIVYLQNHYFIILAIYTVQGLEKN